MNPKTKQRPATKKHVKPFSFLDALNSLSPNYTFARCVTCYQWIAGEPEDFKKQRAEHKLRHAREAAR